MHAHPGGWEWPGSSLKTRRASFLERLASYAAGRRCAVTVVFDGAKGGDEWGGEEAHAGIRVVYSRRGVEADAVILDLIETSARPADVLLVSSDRSVADRARGLGAAVVRADELAGRLRPASVPRIAAADIFERRVKGYSPSRPVERRKRSRPTRHLDLW
jgi:predicted RNA-binding protein with PIN domain